MKRFTEICAAFVAVCAMLCSCARTFPASKESDIVDFLEKYGVCTAGEGVCKDIVIPEEFGEVYEKYNELQKQQGFDLHDHASKDAQVYTFDVASVNGEHRDHTEAHVIVCAGKIIGCDIASSALDGGMEAVIK